MIDRAMSHAMRIGDFKALTFDCYGTLIDWETGLLTVLRPWAERNGLRVSDERLLEAFARAEAAAEMLMPTVPYTGILRDVHARLAQEFGCPADDRDADALAQSVGDWPPFPDTVEALRRLQERYKLVIVSNVDHVSFDRTQTRLGVTFNAAITAEDVGAYKPDERVFQQALTVLSGMGVRPAEVLHVAQSLYHDHVPAKALGLSTVWVDRRKGKSGWGATVPPGIAIRPDLVVGSLAELADHS